MFLESGGKADIQEGDVRLRVPLLKVPSSSSRAWVRAADPFGLTTGWRRDYDNAELSVTPGSVRAAESMASHIF